MDLCVGPTTIIVRALRDTTFQKPFQDSKKMIFEKNSIIKNSIL
jgi:hypothetical protein